MNNYKSKLIVLLIIQALITVIHVVLSKSGNTEPSVINSNWHFWLGLVFGAFVLAYALSIRCQNISCQRLQVFRGLSIFDLRWPNKNCYYCGTSLSSSNNSRVNH